MSSFPPFDHQPRTRLLFGEGVADETGQIAAGLGLRTVLVVTDSGVAAAGHPDRVEASLRAAGVEATRFDGVREDPTTHEVERCRDAARTASVDGFVAVGGGSSIDTAKGAAFLLACGGDMEDYEGHGKATAPLLPLAAIPTTAGTGSECQSYALVACAETHRKMACGDPGAAPRVAILDPTLTVTQPRGVTARTGVDALGHALECAVTSARTPFSLLHAREAFRLVESALEEVLAHPEDLAARSTMQLGAAFAGVAIEASMLGAAHACANPLSAAHGVAHGEAVGVMLAPVIRYNGGDRGAREEYGHLAEIAGLGGADPAEALAERVESLLATAGLATRLSECGVERPDLEALAADAATQWTGRFNPRSLDARGFRGLYDDVAG